MTANKYRTKDGRTTDEFYRLVCTALEGRGLDSRDYADIFNLIKYAQRNKGEFAMDACKFADYVFHFKTGRFK